MSDRFRIDYYEKQQIANIFSLEYFLIISMNIFFKHLLDRFFIKLDVWDFSYKE